MRLEITATIIHPQVNVVSFSISKFYRQLPIVVWNQCGSSTSSSWSKSYVRMEIKPCGYMRAMFEHNLEILLLERIRTLNIGDRHFRYSPIQLKSTERGTSFRNLSSVGPISTPHRNRNLLLVISNYASLLKYIPHL